MSVSLLSEAMIQGEKTYSILLTGVQNKTNYIYLKRLQGENTQKYTLIEIWSENRAMP